MSFNINELPTAFLSNNPKSDNLRKQLIKNTMGISECDQGILEKVFFSNENINLINQNLIYGIYIKSNKSIKISPQNPLSILIVMRFVFSQHARHLPYDIKGQIRDLNCKVLNELLPRVMTEATQHLAYIKEINEPRQLLPLPINATKGKRNDNISITNILT